MRRGHLKHVVLLSDHDNRAAIRNITVQRLSWISQKVTHCHIAMGCQAANKVFHVL